jgi:uncharacterized integral membrane protein
MVCIALMVFAAWPRAPHFRAGTFTGCMISRPGSSSVEGDPTARTSATPHTQRVGSNGMSASSETPSKPTSGHAPRSKRERMRTAVLIVLAILITLFAAKNTPEVKVDWVVGSGRAPLIIVIVVSGLIGVVLGHFAERRSAKRR